MRKAGVVAGTIAAVFALAASCATGAPTSANRVEAEATPKVAQDLAELPYQSYQSDSAGFIVAYRRLTESQYRNSIADIFGPAIKINARFEPERREGGLQAIGNARLSIPTSGLEQYLAVARSIADQVVDGANSDQKFGCSQGMKATPQTCASTFIADRGRLLFRRPLSDEESAAAVSIWRETYEQSGDFNQALKFSLVSLLVSPEFLFRVERAEQDPLNPSGYRLDAYSIASRLSFLLWDTSPDPDLLAAAQKGDLHTEAGLKTIVDRMLSSPKLQNGVRAFFTDMLQFEAFDNLTKDARTYPKFSQAVADSAREETLRFLVNHLVTRAGDYREIFTTRTTVMNRPLAAVYQVPYPSKAAWAEVTFSEQSERSGILTQISFLSLFSHPASSSPTIRGVKLHEIFMCIPTPDPPADVDFSKVQATEGGTVRTRLIDHMTNPGCSSCHLLSDPAGLTLEKFDGLGQFRQQENGVQIDVSARIGGRDFSGAAGLGRYLHDSPLIADCLVKNVHYYGVGRPADHRDIAYLRKQTEAFAEGGYQLANLYRSILSDPEFFKVVRPPEMETSANNQGGSQ